MIVSNCCESEIRVLFVVKDNHQTITVNDDVKEHRCQRLLYDVQNEGQS